MSSIDSNSDAFTCKFKKLNHYYKKPKRLPCANSACANCILSEVSNPNEMQFECKFCSKTHQIHETTPNVELERLFIENLNELVRIEINECKNVSAVLKDKLSKREKRLDKVIDFIENELEIRFESMKIELDKLNTKLLKTVQRVELSIHKKSKKLEEIQHDNELIENARIFSTSLQTLNKFQFTFQATLLPNYYQIGYLNALNMLNIQKIKTKSPKVINLEKLLKYPTCMCTLNNEKLIMTDNQQNEVFILDSNFKFLKRVPRIDDVMFNGLRGIATNNKDSVYICDAGNDRVIISDIGLKRVKRIVGRKGKGANEFDWPAEVCFYDDSIFVLDEINYRIQRFTSSGDFIKIVYTNKVSTLSIERSNIFKKISVDNDLIAISNRYFVYVITFDGIELQKVGHLGVSLKAIYMSDGCLITHNSHGVLNCYGLVLSEAKKDEKHYSLIFERKLELFKKPTSCITKFDDKLLLLCMCDNLIVTI